MPRLSGWYFLPNLGSNDMQQSAYASNIDTGKGQAKNMKLLR